MKKYRISEFADAMNVSTNFIRFYEKNGIIVSTVDESNGYHYYDISQSEIIFKIQLLRCLGYSVKESSHLIRSATFDEIVESLGERKKAVVDNIRRQTYALQRMETLKNNLSVPGGTWYLVQRPAIFFLPHTTDDNYLLDEASNAIYKNWSGFLPYTFSLDRLELDDAGEVTHVTHGRAIEESVADGLSIMVGSPVKHYPTAKYIEYFLDFSRPTIAENKDYLGEYIISEALNIARELKLSLCGELFLRFVAHSHENDLIRDRYIIWLPVQ